MTPHTIFKKKLKKWHHCTHIYAHTCGALPLIPSSLTFVIVLWHAFALTLLALLLKNYTLVFEETPYAFFLQKSQKGNTVDSLKFQFRHSFMARFCSNFTRQVRLSFISCQSTVFHGVDHGFDLQHYPSLVDT